MCLILLASLPNSWEPIRAAITNLIGNAQLQFDVRNTILAEDVHRKDSSEASTSNSTLNIENRGRSSERSSNKGNENRGKSKNGSGKSKNDRNVDCWNCGTTGHLKKNYKVPRKNKDKNNDVANAITDEVHDALILLVDDTCDS